MVLILFIGFVVQLILSKYFSFEGISINIMLLLTIEISLVKGQYYGELFGFFSGLIEDIFVMGIIGTRALIRTMIGLFAGSLKGKFTAQNIFFQFFLTFIVFVVHSFFIYFIRLIFNYPPPMMKNIFVYAGINGILAPIVYYLVKKADAK